MHGPGPGYGDGRGRPALVWRQAFRAVALLLALFSSIAAIHADVLARVELAPAAEAFQPAAEAFQPAAEAFQPAAEAFEPAAETAELGQVPFEQGESSTDLMLFDSTVPLPGANGSIAGVDSLIDERPPARLVLGDSVFGASSASADVTSTSLDEGGLFALAAVGLVLVLVAGRARR